MLHVLASTPRRFNIRAPPSRKHRETGTIRRMTMILTLRSHDWNLFVRVLPIISLDMSYVCYVPKQ